jgi:hypothetical protein
MPIGVFPGKVWFDDVLPYDSKFSTGRHLFGACYKQNRREMNKLPDPQWRRGWTWLKALVSQPRPWKKTNGKVEIWEEQSPQPAEFDLKPLKNDEFYTTTVVLLPCLRGKNRRLRGQDVIWSTSWHPTESKLMGARTMTSSRASATTRVRSVWRSEKKGLPLISYRLIDPLEY